MTLLVPLGLLGLIGIAILIIIYIIRPNYQQKHISSTHIWKLSLKYRKKKIPTSKLRNLILILCQVLILTACAVILSKPAQVLKVKIDETEVIAIIDSSASMRTELDGVTRFERAVLQVQELSEDILNEEGIVSVILAENKASFLAQRVSVTEKGVIKNALTPLVEENLCAYGEADIEGAITLCEDVLLENPSARIYLYTDTEYLYVPTGITVVNVAEESEWNAAILDASAVLQDNFYTFTVDLACYGRAMPVNLTVEITNANPEDDTVGRTITYNETVACDLGKTQQIVFLSDKAYADIYATLGDEIESQDVIYKVMTGANRVYSYGAVYITIDTVTDSFIADNTFNIYNGQKEILKVQYASGVGNATANPFFSGVLYTLKSAYADKWDIRITEVKTGTAPKLEGFDLYLFEHSMPNEMPTDGVVILADPNKAPEGAGFRVDEIKTLRESISLTATGDHKLLKYVNADNITVSRFAAVTADASYNTLISCDTSPVIMVKNEPNSKVMLMNFSLHYSNLSILKEFPLLMFNVFEYFFPSTVEEYDFNVYESVELNSRGETLSVFLGSKELYKFEEFPATLNMDTPGTYALTQTTFTGKAVKEYIYVKIPSTESDIWAVKETLQNPYRMEEESDYFKDLLLYIAIALVSLLFIEWWLQCRETM